MATHSVYYIRFIKLNRLIQACSILLLIAAVAALFTHFLLKLNHDNEEFEDGPSYLEHEADKKSNPSVLIVEEVSSIDTSTAVPRNRTSFSAKT